MCGGSRYPTFDEEQVLMAFAWGIACLIAISKPTQEAFLREDLPWACSGCGYSFEGLGDAGLCPECGEGYSRETHFRLHTPLFIGVRCDHERLARMALPCFFLATTLCFGRFLMYPVLLMHWWDRLGSFDFARWYAAGQVREGVLYGWFPLAWAMCLSPFVTYMESPRRRAWTLAAMVMIMLALAVGVEAVIPKRWTGVWSW